MRKVHLKDIHLVITKQSDGTVLIYGHGIAPDFVKDAQCDTLVIGDVSINAEAIFTGYQNASGCSPDCGLMNGALDPDTYKDFIHVDIEKYTPLEKFYTPMTTLGIDGEKAWAEYLNLRTRLIHEKDDKKKEELISAIMKISKRYEFL